MYIGEQIKADRSISYSLRKKFKPVFQVEKLTCPGGRGKLNISKIHIIKKVLQWFSINKYMVNKILDIK
jgi:hypothetical protein